MPFPNLNYRSELVHLHVVDDCILCAKLLMRRSDFKVIHVQTLYMLEVLELSVEGLAPLSSTMRARPML